MLSPLFIATVHSAAGNTIAQLGICFPDGATREETSPLSIRCRVCLFATLDFELLIKSSRSAKKLLALLERYGICFLNKQPPLSDPLSSLDMNSGVMTPIHFFLLFSAIDDFVRALARS